MSSADEYDPCDAIWGFLELKGSIGLLTLLNDGPRTFSELESEMEITSSTLSRRRVDADALGLLTVELESTEHGTKHVYTLTDMGEHLARQMVLNEITHHYKEMRQHQHQIETRTEDLIAWVKENPSELLQFRSAVDDDNHSWDPAEEPPEKDDIRDSVPDSEASTTRDADDDADAGDDADGERPRPPSEQLTGDVGASSENRTQRTFEEMAADEADTDGTNSESDT